MPSPGIGQRYILVVEDDPALRELYRSALSGLGLAVMAVDDGLAALRRVETVKPSAVVLDLDLPRLGGRDLHQELKAHPDTHHIPIIVVSGQDTSDLDPTQFACILHKPVTVDQLIAAVHRCMRR